MSARATDGAGVEGEERRDSGPSEDWRPSVEASPDSSSANPPRPSNLAKAPTPAKEPTTKDAIERLKRIWYGRADALEWVAKDRVYGNYVTIPLKAYKKAIAGAKKADKTEQKTIKQAIKALESSEASPTTEDVLRALREKVEAKKIDRRERVMDAHWMGYNQAIEEILSEIDSPTRSGEAT